MNEENTPFTPPENPNPPYPPFPPGENRFRPAVPDPEYYGGVYPPRRVSSWRTVKRLFVWFGILVLICMAGFFFLGAIALFSSVKEISTDEYLRNAPVERILAGSEASLKKIVVLPIEGMITEDEFGFVRNCIQAAYEDDRLSGLILRIDSPGGTISGSDYYYNLLLKVKKERKVPVYVSMGGIAASGGYYISTVADKIFAERSTITGSIGVISMMMDASALCEKIGVRSNNIVSGKNKGMGDFTRPMSDEERAIWQSLINQAYEQFLGVIRRGRPAFAPKSEGESAAAEETAESGGAAPDAGAEPSDSSGDNAAADAESAENVADATDAVDEKPAGNAASDNPGGSADGPDPLRALADGRVYSAADAKRLGLVDEIGFLQDAAETMIKEEFKVSDEDVEIVRYRKPESVFSILGVKADPTPAQKAASVIQALSTPTLYYMVPGTLPSFD